MPELPEVDEGLLDDAGLAALLRDVEACTELLEVRVKGGRGQHAAAVDLPGALAALQTGARGLQLRYRHEGSEWWDTVLRGEGGWRVVRIRHSWEQP